MTEDLFDYLDNQVAATYHQDNYKDHQIGHHIQTLWHKGEDWDEAEVVLLGCDTPETSAENWGLAANRVRQELYRLYDWHDQFKVADLGNIKKGANHQDTMAALQMVLTEAEAEHKIVILLGGGHHLMLAQYQAFKVAKRLIEAVVVDRFVDISDETGNQSANFLMPLLTEQPNFVKHFTLLGFQSYNTDFKILETLNDLGFDCVRLGRVRQDLKANEPLIRSCHLFGIDLQALRYNEALFLEDASPNGFYGDELCQLTRYAGMGQSLSSFGIYGYRPLQDVNGQGAKLVAQLLWYFIDGYRIRKLEADLKEEEHFVNYFMEIAGTQTTFIKSKRTNRWWFKVGHQEFMPCSHQDYLEAAAGDIPERWLRSHERMV